MTDLMKSILISAVKLRLSSENKTLDEILLDYPDLTELEKQEVVTDINKPL